VLDLIYEKDLRLLVWGNEVARLSDLHLVEKFRVFKSCDVTRNGATRDKSYIEISKDSQLRCGPVRPKYVASHVGVQRTKRTILICDL